MGLEIDVFILLVLIFSVQPGPYSGHCNCRGEHSVHLPERNFFFQSLLRMCVLYSCSLFSLNVLHCSISPIHKVNKDDVKIPTT